MSNECSYEKCSQPMGGSKKLCVGHYGQITRGQNLRPLRDRASKGRKYCAVKECERVHHGHDYCRSHLNQKRGGGELKPIKTYKARDQKNV